MTIEELSQLSDEELSIKVAEKMGWNRCASRADDEGRVWCKGIRPGRPIRDHYEEILPPFSTSLDAIHEAEATLDGLPMDVRSRWLDWLAITAEWPKTKNAADLRFEVQYLTARATARQRAIAFLSV